MKENRRPSRVTEPVTSGRRDAEDLRSGPVVRDWFLFNRVDVARDDPAVHVQPELALVNTANPTQADLAFTDLAIAGTRRAHDLVRALDRLPELGDLPRRLARRLPDIEDFRFRNHRPSVHWSYRVKTLCDRLPNAGRTEVFPALRQERFPPGFRHENVAARCGDFADYREPATISQGRFRIPREDRRDRIGPDRRDEFVVAPVVQDELLRDRRRERGKGRVPRERRLIDLVRQFRHRGQLAEAGPEAVGEVHAARDRAGIGEEHAVRDPRIRPQELVQRLAPESGRLLEHLRGISSTAEVPRDDDRVARLRAGPEQNPVLPHAAERGTRDREHVRLLRVAAEDRDPELPHALLHPVREAPEELDVGIGGPREGRDEAERPRAPPPAVAPGHRGRPPPPPVARRPPPGVGLPRSPPPPGARGEGPP